jgi:hypothetical protein
LQDILEKFIQELGGPLGGQKVDCSELKVELNHWGRVIAPCEPCDIPTGRIGLKLHYYRTKSIAKT